MVGALVHCRPARASIDRSFLLTLSFCMTLVQNYGTELASTLTLPLTLTLTLENVFPQDEMQKNAALLKNILTSYNRRLKSEILRHAFDIKAKDIYCSE